MKNCDDEIRPGDAGIESESESERGGKGATHPHFGLGERFEGGGHDVDVGPLGVENERVLEQEVHVPQELDLAANHLFPTIAL